MNSNTKYAAPVLELLEAHERTDFPLLLQGSTLENPDYRDGEW